MRDNRIVLDVNVSVNIRHTWVSDLVVELTHTGIAAGVIDRPGIPASPYGCSLDNIVAILDDQAERQVEGKCGGAQPSASAPPMPAIGGSYRSNDSLSRFVGQNVSGEWNLNVSDHYINDTGTLKSWCVEITVAESLPEPTQTPTPDSLPAEALIQGVSGANQKYNLDCEMRSAVDWARYFGISVGEDAFFNRLPVSDNPDVGFVGYVDGTWGLSPPNDYGVHAIPIAKVLQQYGLSAAAIRPLTWSALKAEIASGHPVIVWVIGPVASSYPVFYTASDGHRTVVAPYEHTVIVVGYNSTSVTVLNGAPPYDTYPLDRFLDSWGVLRYMAVVTR